jgi:hypothetical protein
MDLVWLPSLQSYAPKSKERSKVMNQKKIVFVAATNGELWRESHVDPYENENQMMRMNPDE